MNEKDEIVARAIMDGAKQVFRKWGLAKATMEDIAKAAGKGKSTLYYYFKSKEEIFHAIAKDEIDASLRATQEAMDKVENTGEKLSLYVEVLLKEIQSRTKFYTIIMGEFRENMKIIDQIRTYYAEQEDLFVRNLIAYGIERDEFRQVDNDDAGMTSRIVVLMLRGLIMELLVKEEQEDLEPYIESINNLFLKGLLPR
ncbi:MAG: TetR family transcriptional regulator [Ignavibacteriaceae bacterium]|nr:MAG: TetR family transcriptional regulator [Ignavibacteriaceae bacterium]